MTSLLAFLAAGFALLGRPGAIAAACEIVMRSRPSSED